MLIRSVHFARKWEFSCRMVLRRQMHIILIHQQTLMPKDILFLNFLDFMNLFDWFMKIRDEYQSVSVRCLLVFIKLNQLGMRTELN